MSLISYEDFSTHFMTHVRAIETGHTDETGTYDYGVGFNVVCTSNNRVMYFEDHLTSNILPSPFTEQDIVNAAWSNLKPAVKTWATTALTLPSLLGSSWVAPSNLAFSNIGDFTFDTFTNNFTTNIARFEVYPPTNPKSWCVGFKVSTNNSNMDGMYVDTTVQVDTFANTRAEDEILGMAWANVKEQIGGWAKSKYAIPQLVNTVYATSSNDW